MVRVDGELKVAQYCQWDGYPGGVGADIAGFLKSLTTDGKFGNKYEAFKSRVRALTWATQADVEAAWAMCGADGSGMVGMDTSDMAKKRIPEYHRDTGPRILELIAEGKVKKVRDSSEFLEDKVFCEWAYELDLDRQVVRIWKYQDRVPTMLPMTEFMDIKTMIENLDPPEPEDV